jgi:hypothetical protein
VTEHIATTPIATSSVKTAAQNLFDLLLEIKFKLNRILLTDIAISRRVARESVSGEGSEISVEKKNPTNY